MITDPRLSLKETKWSRKSPVSCGRDAPDKINRGGQSAVACDSSKISAFMPQEHQIRIRSDKCENTNAITLVFECGLLYGSNKA